MKMTLTQQALKFAAKKHQGQERRESGLPYIIHPVSVAFFLIEYKGNSHEADVLITASILHDTWEDTNTTIDEIASIFGHPVASLVLELSSDEKEIKRLGKNPYLIKKMITMSSWALVIKLCDRLSNVSDSPKEQYIEDTKAMVSELRAKRNLSGTHSRILESIEEIVHQELS